MGNFSGTNRNIVFEKSCALRILLLLKEKEIKIADIPYALSCIELINCDGTLTNSIKGINPLLMYRRVFLYSLHLLSDNGLVFLKNDNLYISIDGMQFAEGLSGEKTPEIENLFSRINAIITCQDYRNKYLELIKEYDNVLFKNDFYTK